LWGKNPPLYNGLLFGGNIREEFKRGEAPLLFIFPLMLRIHLHIKERGIKGVRLINNPVVI
jgi:hypothetical protein